MALPRRSQVLFNPGPVNLDPAIPEGLFNVELCHRQPEFEELDLSIRARLLTLTGLSRIQGAHYQVSLLHGGGTLAVEAALCSFVRGCVLVVNNGAYCQRILDTLGLLTGVEAVELDAHLGRPPDLGQLEQIVRQRHFDWVAVVHHETTTGLLNPLAEIAGLCRATDTRLFVDAVSSFGVHRVDVGADVICFNSNKCLESLPGVAGVVWAKGLPRHATVPVLDVGAYADGLPFTPNVQAFVALDTALDLLAAEDRPARYRRLARHVWAVGQRQFDPVVDEHARSHVLTAFHLGGRDPDRLFVTAMAHGFVTYHGQGTLRSQMFRVANMGSAINEGAIDRLFEVIA
ncbi:MAG: pyridoxal-phosphate-dependent aminotransferase family protein [Acidimicrobiales bacterium]